MRPGDMSGRGESTGDTGSEAEAVLDTEAAPDTFVDITATGKWDSDVMALPEGYRAAFDPTINEFHLIRSEDCEDPCAPARCLGSFPSLRRLADAAAHLHEVCGSVRVRSILENG